MRAVLTFGIAVLCLFPLGSNAETQKLVLDASVGQELPEGYPWKMGDATIHLNDSARKYTTYDFSIGAFDASVQFRKNYDCSGNGACDDTGKIELSIGAYPDANPDAKGDVVHIKGIFNRLPKGAKKIRDVTVEIQDVGAVAGAYLKSKGPAKLALTAIKRGKDGSDSYGTLSATVTATVCEATEEALVKDGACQAFTAEFVTDVQFDSL